MSSVGASRASTPIGSARAEASRRNGAKSKGPKTPEGKARSSQNALRHGLRAQKHMLLPGESVAEYQRLEAALLEELAPEGALQAVLARRVVSAAWRLERVEQIEVQLFAWNQLDGGGRNLGLALIRDCNNARAFDTLLRYRGGSLAEFWRALRTLKSLQAEQAAARSALLTRQMMFEPQDGRTRCIEVAPDQEAGDARPHAQPIEPGGYGNPSESEPAAAVIEPVQRPRERAHAAASEPAPVPAVALARWQRAPQANEPRLGLAHGETAAAWEAERAAPEAIAPPRERQNPAAPPAQPSRSTP